MDYFLFPEQWLTQRELEEIAANINLDESDVDDDLLSDSSENEDEAVLLPRNDVPDSIDDADSDSSDDNVPLVNFVTSKKRRWLRGDFHAPPRQFDHHRDVREVKKPVDYFNRYLGDSFFESLAKFTNMREVLVTGKSLGTTAKEMKVFFACCIIISIYKLPRLKMFWQRDSRVPIVSDNISRNRFYSLRTRLKIVDDNIISKEQKEADRFWKIRPMLDMIQKACRENFRTQEISIDEQMVPFHGKVAMKQYVRGKPNPVGLKNFVMTTPGGIPLDFYLYEGKGHTIESALIPTPEKLDVGGRMVLKLTDTLPQGTSVYTDRYFTSISLIDTLLLRSITLAGTIMNNRIPKEIDFKKDNELKKAGRGSFDFLIREDKKMCAIKWFDSRPVHFASSVCGAEPVGSCTRWSKAERKYIEVNQPAVVKSYNINMGGVDLLDRVIGNYAIRTRTRKWTIRAIFHFLDFVSAASWLEYREDAADANMQRKEILDYFNFKFSIARDLLAAGMSNDSDTSIDSESGEDDVRSRKRRRIRSVPDRSSRRKHAKHMPINMSEVQKTRSKCRYPGCKMLTFVKCKTCNVFLCFSTSRNCYSKFHEN